MTADFKNHCREIAKEFLQTVIVIDDRATFLNGDRPGERLVKENTPSPEQNEQTPEVIEPKQSPAISPEAGIGKPSVLRTRESKEAHKAVRSEEGQPTGEESPGESAAHILDAQSLTTAFFSEGIIAGLYKPTEFNQDTDENTITKTVAIARKSDAVIIDWMLDEKAKTPKVAKEIIARLIEQDYAEGGRLRTIIVYTAEKDLHERRNELFEYLANKDIRTGTTRQKIAFQRDADYTITSPNLRIAFYNKQQARSVDDIRKKSESELPEVLLDEFATHADGLLPAFALKSAASIRSNTHHILTRFPKGLDIAYLMHRAAIPDPEDAEPYMLENFISIARSYLGLERVDQRCLGIDTIQKWTDDQKARNVEFEGEIKLADKRKTIKVTPAELKDPLIVGEKESKRLIRNKLEISSKDFKDIECQAIIRAVTPLFNNGSIKTFHDFAVLNSFKRSHADIMHMNHTHAPYLSQGTILCRLADDNSLSEFLICVTPRCDSLRISNSRKFSFASFKQVDQVKSYDLVVKVNDDYYCLQMEKKFYRLVDLSFEPDSDTKRIQPIYDGEKRQFIFRSDDAKLLWVGDLKDLHAQNRVAELVKNLNRVGYDEFEWLRLIGLSGADGG